MRALNEALTSMRRSPYQSLAALFVISLTFFIGYTYSLFLYGANTVLGYFETQPQVIAFFELETPTETITELKTKMEGQSYVKEVSVISKDQALSIYQQENRDDPLLLELVTAEILPASIEVSGVDVSSLTKIKDDLEGVPGVDEVVFQEDVIESLNNWTSTIRFLGVASLSILSITSVLVIMIITAIKVTNQRVTVKVMRMIGATKWYVKSPFVMEGMLYSLIGSIVGWIGMFTLLLYVQPGLQAFLGTVSIFPISLEFFAIQFAIGTIQGILLAGIATDLAVGRMAKGT